MTSTYSTRQIDMGVVTTIVMKSGAKACSKTNGVSVMEKMMAAVKMPSNTLENTVEEAFEAVFARDCASTCVSGCTLGTAAPVLAAGDAAMLAVVFIDYSKWGSEWI